MMVLNIPNPNAFRSILCSLALLLIIAGCHEHLQGNTISGAHDDTQTIPPGVYTVNLKSLYVRETTQGPDRRILKRYLALNIKSSWSDIGNTIAFIQVPLIDILRTFENWTPAICVMTSEGKGFRQLTDGRFGDFNPTWIRGKEEILFSRLNQTTNHWAVYVTTPHAVPGQEIRISDPAYNEAGVTTTQDGRVLIQSDRSGRSRFYVLVVARDRNGAVSGHVGTYQELVVDMPEAMTRKRIVRESISPDNSKLVFELAEDPFDMQTSVIFVADLSLQSHPPKVSRAYPIVPLDKTYATIYPKWTVHGDAIIYVSNQTGTYQIYRYVMSTGTTERLSSRNDANYTYFSPKNLPN